MQRIENVNKISHFWHANANKIHLLTAHHLNQQRLDFLSEHHANINQLNFDQLEHKDLLVIKNYATVLKLYSDFLIQITTHFINNGLQAGCLTSFRDQINTLYESCLTIREKIDKLLETHFKITSEITIIPQDIDARHCELKQLFYNDCDFMQKNNLLISPFEILTQNIEKEDKAFLGSLLTREDQDDPLNCSELSDNIKKLLAIYLSFESIIQLSTILILSDSKKTPFIHRPLIKEIRALGFHDSASENSSLNKSLELLAKNKNVINMNQSQSKANTEETMPYFRNNTFTQFNSNNPSTIKPRKRASSQPSFKIPTPVSSTSKRLFSLISPRENKSKADSSPRPGANKK